MAVTEDDPIEWAAIPDPDALTDDWPRNAPLQGFYQCITCQPHLVPEHEQRVIRAVQRLVWLQRRSWLFWFRLDPVGTLADSYSGHDEPMTRGEP